MDTPADIIDGEPGAGGSQGSGGPQEQGLVRLLDQPPQVLPAVVLDDLVPFPGPVAPILLDSQHRRDAVLHAKNNNNGFFALINRRGAGRNPEPEIKEVISLDGVGAEALPEVEAHELSGTEPPAKTPPTLGDLNSVGVLARVVRVFQLPDERLSGLVQLVRRLQPVEVLRTDPFLAVRVIYPVEVVRADEGHGQTFDAVFRQLRLKLQAFFEAHPTVSEELKLTAMGIESPSIMADFVAQHLARDYDERLAFLTELDLARRVRRALEVVIRELDLLNIGNRISDEIRQKIENHQREYFLREQLKAIRTELGEEKDPATLAVQELERKLEAAGLPPPARERADEELRRLRMVPVESPEHNVVRSYLDWIACLPWSRVSEDNRDLQRARAILDADHYGLEEIKERIIEFLAVRQLNPGSVGSILCFAGPPGVGKTSLGRSIARALGRSFYRFSVGGMRDEAEIKGHRRTYIGAMPGRILQALKLVQTANPVVMLDELDKMGADWRGDPSSAMLEVLDPAQNRGFLDHYLDLPFDLSRVMFIATANIKTEIPPPLLDRLEVIDLPGYIPGEKLEIALRHLLPKQRKEHGLATRQLRIGRTAVQRIVREYTMEAGVRELERQLSRICRKRATQVVEERTFRTSVAAADLPEYLGPPKIHDERLEQRPKPGVTLGLAWTPVGGDVLFIEAVAMAGKGLVKVTGHLGEVMSESSSLAISYVRNHAQSLGIDPKRFTSQDFHLHFPAGAVRKDGPSAGVTITTAFVSLLTNQPIRAHLAMTGEMTLRGEVLPVGGIREKVVAARRVGVRTVILPERNRADIEEIPETVRKHIDFVFASSYDDVLAAAFARPIGAAPGERKAPTQTKRASSTPAGRSAKRSAAGGKSAKGRRGDSSATRRTTRGKAASSAERAPSSATPRRRNGSKSGRPHDEPAARPRRPARGERSAPSRRTTRRPASRRRGRQ